MLGEGVLGEGVLEGISGVSEAVRKVEAGRNIKLDRDILTIDGI